MIALDNRAGSKDLFKPLAKLGLPVELMRLDSGDVAFIGRGEGGVPVHVGVEYKKFPELISSLRDDRLAGHQLLKMQEAFDFNYLLIQGELLYDASGQLLKRCGHGRTRPMAGRMSVHELYKRLFVLHLRGGLNLLPWGHNLGDCCQTLAALYRTWTDCDLDQHHSHIALYRPPALCPISEFRTFMQSFTGVGFEVSRAIEKHFGANLERAILAPKSEWMKINGVGDKLATRIRETISGKKMGD